jgi:hypothetical protein
VTKKSYKPNFELFPQEDELISSHEEENERPVILTADTNILEPDPVLNSNKSEIKIPWYMQNRDTTILIDYQES